MSEDAKDVDDIFADAAEKRRAIAAQLSGRPVEEVLGLVGASGACGWPVEGGRWTLSFGFETWKIPPGPWKQNHLRVDYVGTPEDFESLSSRIATYTVFRIRARVVEESVFGTSVAELVEFLGPDESDPELNQAAIDLQKPAVVTDRQFGELTLDRRVNWYTADTTWNGAAVALHLGVDPSGSLDGALATARSLWKDQARWAERIADYAVQRLLPVKNDSWLDEDEEEAELTPQDFRSLMDLDSISVSPDGSFEFWHDDGDMFLGHSILIRGDLDSGPTQADIAG